MRETRGLTIGDALALSALLVFILAWLAGWSFLLWWYEEEGNDTSDLGTWDSTVLVVLAGWPCMWAGHMVREIVAGPWSRR